MDDPYRRADRIDAHRLVDHDPFARAFVEHIAHVYLQGSLTMAEIRALVTLGLEHGMMLETKPIRARAGSSTGGQGGGKTAT